MKLLKCLLLLGTSNSLVLPFSTSCKDKDPDEPVVVTEYDVNLQCETDPDAWINVTKAKEKEQFNATISLNKEDNIFYRISILCNDVQLEENKDYSFNKENGQLIINKDVIVGNISITIITAELVNVSVNCSDDKATINKVKAIKYDEAHDVKENYEGIITIEDGCPIDKEKFNLTIGGQEGQALYQFDYENNKLTIDSYNVTGDIVITFSCIHEVNVELSEDTEHITKIYGDHAEKNKDYEPKLELEDGYSTEDEHAISITIDGGAPIDKNYFCWEIDKNNRRMINLHIDGGKITGDIVISVKTKPESYQASINNGFTFEEQKTPQFHEEFKVKIQIASNTDYEYFIKIKEIKMGENEETIPANSYKFDGKSNELTINKNVITGDIFITADKGIIKQIGVVPGSEKTSTGTSEFIFENVFFIGKNSDELGEDFTKVKGEIIQDEETEKYESLQFVESKSEIKDKTDGIDKGWYVIPAFSIEEEELLQAEGQQIKFKFNLWVENDDGSITAHYTSGSLELTIKHEQN